MQQANLFDFKKDIENVREYIKHIELINNIVMSNQDTHEPSIQELSAHLKQFSTQKKIFEYKAIIISLYGIIEKHMEIWVRAYIKNLSEFVSNYNNLDVSFREAHLNFSLKLIGEVIQGRHSKYDQLTAPNIISNLHNCFSVPSQFVINEDAFIMSTGNLSHNKIVELFTPFKISIGKLYSNDIEFDNYLKSIFGPTIRNMHPDILYNKLNDLVSRRNEISHGSLIESILNISEFEDYLVFLENYGQAVFNTITQKELEHEASFIYDEIEIKHKVFQGGTVLVFELEKYNIKVGDYIIICDVSNLYSKQEILNIEVDKVSYTELSILEKKNIGILLEDRVSIKSRFFLKRKAIVD